MGPTVAREWIDGQSGRYGAFAAPGLFVTTPPPVVIDTAMILAAGRGERMRPDRPRPPLLTVAGKPLIVWHIGVSPVPVSVTW